MPADNKKGGLAVAFWELPCTRIAFPARVNSIFTEYRQNRILVGVPAISTTIFETGGKSSYAQNFAGDEKHLLVFQRRNIYL